MEVRIGVTQSVKEIELDLEDTDRDTTLTSITESLTSGEGVLWLTDKRGRTVGVLAPEGRVCRSGQRGRRASGRLRPVADRSRTVRSTADGHRRRTRCTRRAPRP